MAQKFPMEVDDGVADTSKKWISIATFGGWKQQRMVNIKKQWKFLKPAAAFQKILGQVPICFLFIPRVCCSVQFPIFGPFCRVIKLNPIEKNQGGP